MTHFRRKSTTAITPGSFFVLEIEKPHIVLVLNPIKYPHFKNGDKPNRKTSSLMRHQPERDFSLSHPSMLLRTAARPLPAAFSAATSAASSTASAVLARYEASVAAGVIRDDPRQRSLVAQVRFSYFVFPFVF